MEREFHEKSDAGRGGGRGCENWATQRHHTGVNKSANLYLSAITLGAEGGEGRGGTMEGGTRRPGGVVANPRSTK